MEGARRGSGNTENRHTEEGAEMPCGWAAEGPVVEAYTGHAVQFEPDAGSFRGPPRGRGAGWSGRGHSGFRVENVLKEARPLKDGTLNQEVGSGNRRGGFETYVFEHII